jgi:hypothetical protein
MKLVLPVERKWGDKLVVVPNLTKPANYSGDEMDMTSSKQLQD